MTVLTAAVTAESTERLRAAGVDVTPIPLQEGLAQGLNSVLLWGEVSTNYAKQRT